MWDRILAVTLVISILGAFGVLAYVAVAPRAEEKFTEFYILGREGKATDYPAVLNLGESGNVTVGIINRERGVASYRVEVRIDGVETGDLGTVVLEPDREWTGIVAFTPAKVSDSQKIEFFLYKNGETKPYLEPLYLWVDVR